MHLNFIIIICFSLDCTHSQLVIKYYTLILEHFQFFLYYISQSLVQKLEDIWYSNIYGYSVLTVVIYFLKIIVIFEFTCTGFTTCCDVRRKSLTRSALIIIKTYNRYIMSAMFDKAIILRTSGLHRPMTAPPVRKLYPWFRYNYIRFPHINDHHIFTEAPSVSATHYYHYLRSCEPLCHLSVITTIAWYRPTEQKTGTSFFSHTHEMATE